MIGAPADDMIWVTGLIAFWFSSLYIRFQSATPEEHCVPGAVTTLYMCFMSWSATESMIKLVVRRPRPTRQTKGYVGCPIRSPFKLDPQYDLPAIVLFLLGYLDQGLSFHARQGPYTRRPIWLPFGSHDPCSGCYRRGTARYFLNGCIRLAGR